MATYEPDPKNGYSNGPDVLGFVPEAHRGRVSAFLSDYRSEDHLAYAHLIRAQKAKYRHMAATESDPSMARIYAANAKGGDRGIRQERQRLQGKVYDGL